MARADATYYKAEIYIIIKVILSIEGGNLLILIEILDVQDYEISQTVLRNQNSIS